jgi:uncharacterized membrane protein
MATSTPVSGRIDVIMRALLRHWLATANVVNGLTVGGAALTPLLEARGWTPLATVLYLLYRPLCPQRPEHSYFIAGYKMAFEQRETAIYLGLLLGGLLFAPVRRWLRPLSWRGLALAALPLLIDVLSQTAGLRGSDWRWRTATGIVFALALVWWAYPYLERDLTAPAPRPGERRTPAEHARAIVLANQDTPPTGERR